MCLALQLDLLVKQDRMRVMDYLFADHALSNGLAVAALVCCRTDEELDAVIKPELANCITAFDESFTTTMARWWKTGARFDAATWAEKCSFFTLVRTEAKCLRWRSLTNCCLRGA